MEFFMNFSPKLIAVSAIALSSTLAMAQVNVKSGDAEYNGPAFIKLSVDIEQEAKIELADFNVSGADLTPGTTGTPAAVGAVSVQTNMSGWNVVVSAVNSGKLKGALSGGNLRFQKTATTTAEARVQLTIAKCTTPIKPLATTVATDCPLPATGGTILTMVPTGLKTTHTFGHALGKAAAGFTTAEMLTPPAPVLTHGAVMTSTSTNFLAFGVYAAIVDDVATPAKLSFDKLVPDAKAVGKETYSEEISFNLVSTY
jgi:hypothetical protein